MLINIIEKYIYTKNISRKNKLFKKCIPEGLKRYDINLL